MNDSELHARLQASRVPGREPGYWQDFPARVAAKLHRYPQPLPASHHWRAPLAWGGAVAMACLVIGFLIGRMDGPIVERLLHPEHQLRRQWAAMPNGFGAVIQNEQTLRAVEAETP